MNLMKVWLMEKDIDRAEEMSHYLIFLEYVDPRKLRFTKVRGQHRKIHSNIAHITHSPFRTELHLQVESLV
jgi:hypothetical protein